MLRVKKEEQENAGSKEKEKKLSKATVNQQLVFPTREL